MAIGSFTATALAGAALWSGALLALGYFLGNHLVQIDTIFHQFGVFIVLAFILAGAYYISSKRKAMK